MRVVYSGLTLHLSNHSKHNTIWWTRDGEDVYWNNLPIKSVDNRIIKRTSILPEIHFIQFVLPLKKEEMDSYSSFWWRHSFIVGRNSMPVKLNVINMWSTCRGKSFSSRSGSCLHIIHLHSDTVTVGHESEMDISDRFLYSSTCICVMVINGELSTLGFPQHVYTWSV